MSALIRLKRRADFLRVARAQRKRVMPGLILQVAQSINEQSLVRVGFTASRRTGNAVKRNRIRRRLRAVAAAVLPGVVRVGYDLVLIGRTKTLGRPYTDLLADLKTALYSLGVSWMDGRIKKKSIKKSSHFLKKSTDS